MVNHELRNALAAVFGWAEMLVRRKDPATVPRAAFEVLDSAEQAIGLINDLLDLSRLDEDRLKPVIREVDCAGVVRQAISRVTPPADGASSVRLEPMLRRTIAHLPDRPAPGGADPGQPAGQRDPAHAEREQRAVHAGAPRAGDVVFRIEDEGPGVAAGGPGADLRHLRDQGRRRGKGTGWACRCPAGWPGCWAVSSAPRPSPSGGGCFVLRLPAAPA